MKKFGQQAHLEYRRHRTKVSEIKSDFVFCRIDGAPIKSFSKAWWSGLKEAGIEDFHFHDLRHTFCSNLLMAGGDLKGVKEMIGHADISMTDRYSHLSNIHKRNLQKKLSKHYSVDLKN
jgi:site-specific recombinase XerD